MADPRDPLTPDQMKLGYQTLSELFGQLSVVDQMLNDLDKQLKQKNSEPKRPTGPDRPHFIHIVPSAHSEPAGNRSLVARELHDDGRFLSHARGVPLATYVESEPRAALRMAPNTDLL